MNKEKEISKYLNSIKISLQIELLGKITGNILFFWIVIWFAAIFLIYIFQIPNYFWKYSNFAMLILGTVLFIKKKNRNISLLFNHHKKQNFIYAFLIKHLPQKEDYLIYNEFKNKTNEKNFIWRAAFKQLLMQQNVSDFEKIVKDRKNGIRVVKFILLIIVSFIILVLSLNISKKVNHFWLHPLTEYIEPTPFQFNNLVKTKKIFEGDSIYFKVAIKGEDVEKAWVQVKELSTHTISRILLKEIKKMQKEDSLFKTKKITITEKIVYRYYCSTSGYLQNKKAFHSEEFSLDYIKFPKITRLEFKIVPPQYTSLKTQYYLEDHTNINCYAGSKLEIAGRISEKVDEISVIFNNTEKKSDSILEKFNFNFSIKNQGELSISYVVFDSFYLEYPVKYTINILKDENPYIQLLSPVGQIELGNDLSVNLKLKAMDDFGLSKMEMHKKRYAANVDTIKTVVDVTEWLSEKRINSIDKNLSFMDDYLLPEEKMDIFFKIYDNDVINSSKTAVSDFFTVIIPTFEQIAANVSREMQRVVSETNDIMKKSRKINSELEKIKREVRQSKEMDWEQKQKITEQLNKAKQIEESLQNIQNKIETNISRMKKNDMI
ncbi:MAG: hypothetical protein KAR38_08960, partial [Calditrichia bacterium]|nr:hypothetical protein [Calditrichia bacterium]